MGATSAFKVVGSCRTIRSGEILAEPQCRTVPLRIFTLWYWSSGCIGASFSMAEIMLILATLAPALSVALGAGS